MSERESIYATCSSEVNPNSEVLCARHGDSIRLLCQPQMDFSLNDARRLANTILDLLGESAGDSLVDDVCAEFQAQSRKGQKEYGQKMTRQDLSLSDWLRHMKEEMMDGVLYAEASLRRLDRVKNNGK